MSKSSTLFDFQRDAVLEAQKREKAKSKQLFHMEWQAVGEDGKWRAKLVKVALTPAEKRQEIERERQQEQGDWGKLLGAGPDTGVTLRGISLAAQIFGADVVRNALLLKAAAERKAKPPGRSNR